MAEANLGIEAVLRNAFQMQDAKPLFSKEITAFNRPGNRAERIFS